MSHRLARLRVELQDELFVRSPRGLLPTPRAEGLAAPLGEALRALDAVVGGPPRFDPETSAYSVAVALPDLLAPLASRMVAGLMSRAPRLQVRLCNLAGSLSEALARGEPALALAPVRQVTGRVITRVLGEVQFGVVGRRGHPALRGKLKLEPWLAHGHVVVRLGNEQSNLIETALARNGLSRRVGLEVPSFLAGLFAVAQSDLLINAPVPLVDEVARTLNLTVREAPIRLPRVRIALCWHERFQTDSAHAWVREQVYRLVNRSFR